MATIGDEFLLVNVCCVWVNGRSSVESDKMQKAIKDHGEAALNIVEVVCVTN